MPMNDSLGMRTEPGGSIFRARGMEQFRVAQGISFDAGR